MDELIFTHTVVATPGHKKILNLGTLNGINDDKWCLRGIKSPQTKSDSTFRIPTYCGCSCPNYFVVLLSPGWQDPSVPWAPQTFTAAGPVQPGELYIHPLCQTAGKEKCVQVLEIFIISTELSKQESPMESKWKSFYWWNDSVSSSLIQYLIELTKAFPPS